MGRQRINLMIMTPGAPERPVRSYSLPSYLPRLLIVVGSVFGVVLVATCIMTVYYFRSIQLIEALKSENETLKKAMAQVSRLQTELEYHRDFTRRVAEMLGISVPDFADSAQVALAASEEASLGANVAAATTGDHQTPGSLIPGILVSDCSPDPDNRPRGMPVNGPLSRGFAPSAANPELRHSGIDFAVREGTSVLATADGQVEYAGADSVYGFLIVINHANGFKTTYGHNSVILVATGDHVQRGDRIAFSGNTGVSTAPHLHYEIVENGQPVDPTKFLGK
ncbi:MAG: M23 family metallopeptidase [Candidatus Zixiibacteriota bacterium]